MTSATLIATGHDRHARAARIVSWALGAVALCTGVLLLVTLPINFMAQTDASLVELASFGAAALILRLAIGDSRLLQLAVLSQAADMLTFVLGWQRGDAERNPIAHVVIDWALTFLPGTGTFPFAVAGMALVVAKVGLVLLIVRVTPFLGRYRHVVLTVALVAGLVGAGSNVVAFWPA